MRILVCPHHMGMGGSQLNAVELAAQMASRGHDMTIYAPDGVLVERVKELGITYFQAPLPGNNKLWKRRLAEIITERNIDLVHAYEWGPSIDAAFTAGLRGRTPVLMSVMSMGVPEFLPKHLPVTVGTPALATELAWQHRTAFLLEPPVDMDHNRSADVAAARESLGVAENDIVVSMVSMFTTELEKLQGILTAISLIDRLATDAPVRLLVAGDGPGLPEAASRAAEINTRHGRTVIDLLGYVADPRPVYEAADIVVGMGSSAIKALAFGKPLIVQGEAGYWQLLDEDHAAGFMHHGWFGEDGNGIADLERHLLALLHDPARRRELGNYGRNLVKDRYHLAHGAKELEAIYLDMASRTGNLGSTATSLLRTAVGVSRFRTAMKSGAVTEREKWSHSGVGL